MSKAKYHDSWPNLVISIRIWGGREMQTTMDRLGWRFSGEIGQNIVDAEGALLGWRFTKASFHDLEFRDANVAAIFMTAYGETMTI